MAMQSGGGASNHGVIQSSIALLQERFRQLQREKEMRERRQLLKNTTILLSSPSTSPSSSSDSELGNYYFNSHSNDHFKLIFADEVADVRRSAEISPPLHHHHHPVSLSLWPGGSEGYAADSAPVLKSLQGAKGEDYKMYSSYGCLGLDAKLCDDSNVCDVDTSLHL